MCGFFLNIGFGGCNPAAPPPSPLGGPWLVTDHFDFLP